MRIGIMVGPETRRYAAKVDQMVDDAKAADEAGFATGMDPPAPAGLRRHDRGRAHGTRDEPHRARHRGGATAVAPPVALGQQALSVQAACGGRFRLGVGPSHHWIIDDMLGLPYEQPAKLVEDYLDVFDAMFAGPNPVDVENDRFRIHNPLDVTDLPVPGAARGAGSGDAADRGRAGRRHGALDGRREGDRRARGAPDHEGGRGARVGPRRGVVAGVAVCLCAPTRSTRAIERANEALGHAEYSPNYQRLLEQGDADDVGDMSAIGTEADIERRLRSYADAGTTDFSVADPAAGQRARRDRRLVAAARASSWRRWRPSSRDPARVDASLRATSSGAPFPRWRPTPRRASVTPRRSSTVIDDVTFSSSSPTRDV